MMKSLNEIIKSKDLNEALDIKGLARKNRNFADEGEGYEYMDIIETLLKADALNDFVKSTDMHFGSKNTRVLDEANRAYRKLMIGMKVRSTNI